MVQEIQLYDFDSDSYTSFTPSSLAEWMEAGRRFSERVLAEAPTCSCRHHDAPGVTLDFILSVMEPAARAELKAKMAKPSVMVRVEGVLREPTVHELASLGLAS